MALSERLQAGLAELEWPEDEDALAEAFGGIPVVNEDTGELLRYDWPERPQEWGLGAALVAELVRDHGCAHLAMRPWRVFTVRAEPEQVRVRRLTEPQATAARADYLFTIDAGWAFARLRRGAVDEAGRRQVAHRLDWTVGRVEPEKGRIAPKVHAEPAALVERWTEPILRTTAELLELGTQMRLFDPPPAGS